MNLFGKRLIMALAVSIVSTGVADTAFAKPAPCDTKTTDCAPPTPTPTPTPTPPPSPCKNVLGKPAPCPIPGPTTP